MSGSHARGNSWLIQVLTPVSVLATAVVGVRFSLRVTRRAGFWLDDWNVCDIRPKRGNRGNRNALSCQHGYRPFEGLAGASVQGKSQGHK